MKITKYQTAILLGIAVVILVAFLDIKSALSGVFGTFDNYTNGDFTAGWWSLFKTIVIMLFLIVPITYYFLVKRDKSEAIAIFVSSYIIWMFGLADLFYFWLQGKMLPSTLPWLVGHPIMGRISELVLHTKEIVPMTIYISVILGFVVVYFSTKLLEKIN